MASLNTKLKEHTSTWKANQLYCQIPGLLFSEMGRMIETRRKEALKTKSKLYTVHNACTRSVADVAIEHKIISAHGVNNILSIPGCQANLFYADEPKPQLEVLTDAFWDYVAKATQTADDTLQMIRKTQFGQEVK